MILKQNDSRPGRHEARYAEAGGFSPCHSGKNTPVSNQEGWVLALYMAQPIFLQSSSDYDAANNRRGLN